MVGLSNLISRCSSNCSTPLTKLARMPISVSEASSHILYGADSRFLQEESVLLSKAKNRVTTKDLCADRDYPPYDRVMMDGICTSSHLADTTTPLKIIGTINAGDEASQQLGKNEAWRINTGAALPADCDLVIPVEELSFTDELVQISTDFSLAPFKFVHKCGSDIRKGETVLPAGSLLNSASLSIAVSIGKLEVPVRKTPKVIVLTTGQEAIPPEQSPTKVQIRRSHPTALATCLDQLGIQNTQFHHLSDDEYNMCELLQDALSNADVILTCGAISKGTSDYLGNIFRDLLGDPLFHGVTQRPGKPLAFWASEGKPLVFALPGNA